jgi:manganese-transporting P-type ATPase
MDAYPLTRKSDILLQEANYWINYDFLFKTLYNISFENKKYCCNHNYYSERYPLQLKIMTFKGKVSKLVDSNQIKSTSLLVERPFIARLYFWPFIILYAGWLSVWLYLTRVNPTVLKTFLEASISSNAKYPFLTFGFWVQYEEFMLIPLGFLCFIHFMTVMGCTWNIGFNAFITCRSVGSVEIAEFILVNPQEHRGRSELCSIVRKDDSIVFSYQQRTFYWNSDKNLFEKPSYPDNLPFSQYSSSTGLSADRVKSNVERFGLNEFDLPVPTFLSLFKEHVKAPFFVFQIFCVGLWCLDEYWYYSVFTLLMLVVFESTVVQQRLKTLKEFRGMSVPAIDMYVHRDGRWLGIKSSGIVPGDVCALPFTDKLDADGPTIPCDLILLQGSCIVNEAMISGESTPLLKESIVDVDGSDIIDFSETDRNHVLFGGTKVLQIHTTTSSEASSLSLSPLPGDLNCPFIVGYAARTGFGTLQGKLVRTMIFSSEHVSANNVEAFMFIGFLLIFALIAAGYVLVKGVEEEGRSRYKLLIECTLIITAVVPPELPMELSMAVNNSLQELAKYAIFCMEPFRIPLAGKLDICCFDKTGTITAENLIVEGIAGLDSSDRCRVLGADFCSVSSGEGREMALLAQKVMSVCHSLFLVRDGKIAGDPMEKGTLEFLNWDLSSSDEVKPSGTSSIGTTRYQICHRFPFSSALKRMSVISKSSTGRGVFVGVKGAPEVLQGRFRSVPEWYERTFRSLAQSGARVIALGHRELASGFVVPKSFKQAERDGFECDLTFCGFLVFRCPLKADSRAALRQLRASSHGVMMITGDNALTAIHTAREVEMIDKASPVLLFDVCDGEEDALSITDAQSGHVCDWLKAEELVMPSCDAKGVLAAMQERQVSLCFTGNAYDLLASSNSTLSLALLPHTAIFARTSPNQKEMILARLKSAPLSLHTLMCGDGTNDVGALKQAHVGMALLDGRPEDLNKILKSMRDSQIRAQQRAVLETRQRWGNESTNRSVTEMLAALEQSEAGDGNNLVKLGDASVAAPFTSKISTIRSVCNLIRLGRSTLVTTIQMYKILALNSLIYAYNLSVLNLSGIRYGDFQMTVTGMLLSACFLFLTRGRALQEMSAKRPQSNIFNVYLLSSVLLQFALHVLVLVFVTQSAARFEMPWRVSEKLKFQPGLMNTAVYLLGLCMQVSTFVVNYQGRPFRESLLENRPLRNSLAAVGAICAIAALELFPEFNEWLELVPMPPAFKVKLVSALVLDFSGCFLIEFLAHRLFFSDKPRLVKLLK